LFLATIRQTPRPTLFPYTTLFRSQNHVSYTMHRLNPSNNVRLRGKWNSARMVQELLSSLSLYQVQPNFKNSCLKCKDTSCRVTRSEEHTSELQSRENLVCRLLLEK